MAVVRDGFPYTARIIHTGNFCLFEEQNGLPYTTDYRINKVQCSIIVAADELRRSNLTNMPFEGPYPYQ